MTFFCILGGTVCKLCFGQTNRISLIPVYPTQKAVVSYKILVSLNDLTLRIEDTFFIFNDFIFEPIHGDLYTQFSKIDTNTLEIKEDISRRSYSPNVLITYYLSNLKDRTGMGFDLNTIHSSIHRSFTIQNKGLGHFFVNEPFFRIMDTAGNFQQFIDYIHEKDTIVNNHNCVIVSNKKGFYTTSNPGVTDSLIRQRLILDKELKGFCFTFISRKACEQFNGTIIQVESEYASGYKVYFNYEYKNGLPADQEVLMDKYIRLYQNNKNILDTLKR